MPDPSQLAAALSVAERAALTAGADMWTVAGDPERGIPRVVLTDGPNGARGSGLLAAGAHSATCMPCGSALGATWDAELVGLVGRLLGREARAKGARVLLAPTLNLHRHPLGGRNFESYGEDPHHVGRLAVAFIRGVQSEGVAATAKHYVANETETERTTASSEVSETALRELYLRPFELAVTDGGVWAVMTAYNRVNGTWCAEHDRLVGGILRAEWGFDGVVMTDWFAAGSTVASAHAGVDLEMPGPARFFGHHLAAAVAGGQVGEATLAAMAERWLRLVDRVDAWHDEPVDERTLDLPEHRSLADRAAADAMVLLTNDGVLPLGGSQTVALLGPNAAVAHVMGGGSAALRPHALVPPLEPLRARLGARLLHEPGCRSGTGPAPLGRPLVVTPSGEPGVAVEVMTSSARAQGGPSAPLAGQTVGHERRDTFRLLWFDAAPAGIAAGGEFAIRASARMAVEHDGAHTFTLVQAGRARLAVDGRTVLDGFADPPPHGEALWGLASQEVAATVELRAGTVVTVTVEYDSAGATGLRGVIIGHEPPTSLERAAEAAGRADAAVVVVGTSDAWESEGRDRPHWRLPGDQEDLVAAVCAANHRTVVVVNAGAVVDLSCADEAAAVIVAWLGGEGMAAALDAVLFGEAEPAGRLPVTFPRRIEHVPSHGTLPPVNHRVEYREGLHLGYRWYASRHLPVRHPFGHGGSYTTFAWGDVALRQVDAGDPLALEVVVEVANTGARRGAEVVQCYVVPPPDRPHRPVLALGGFTKLWLAPGQRATAVVPLDPRAFATWDEGALDAALLRARTADTADLVPSGAAVAARDRPGWYVDAGRHEVLVARSATDVVARLPLELPELGPLEPPA